MVDLSELKAGDTVVFRNGKKNKVRNVIKNPYDTLYKYCIETDGGFLTYKENGFFNIYESERESEFDIVEIIPQEQPAEKSDDSVNHPSHYTSGDIECIQYIKASMTPDAYKGYLKGNVLKYLWRYEKKANTVEDLKKAQTYLEWLIKEN